MKNMSIRIVAFAPSSWLACLTVFLVSACGGGSDTNDSLAGGLGEGPLPPTPTLSASIGAEGGTIRGPAGSIFEGLQLVVPAGALTATTTLTMTPVIDALPLSATAERVGPQYSITPAELAFLQPVSLTVPFDRELRGAWAVPDSDARVWYRKGEGWANAIQTASTSDSVTVPLLAATVFAAGVLRPVLPTVCSGTNLCTKTLPTFLNCRDGANFCLNKIGSYHKPALTGFSSYTNGTLFWLTAPALAQPLALTGFSVASRSAVATTQPVGLATTSSVVGEVVVDNTGTRWLSFRNFGTVRFAGTAPPEVFDSSATQLPLGVGLNSTTGQAVRFRSKDTSTSNRGERGRFEISAASGQQPYFLGTFSNTILGAGGDQSLPPRKVVDNGPLGYLVDFADNGIEKVLLANRAASPIVSRLSQGSCGVEPRQRTNLVSANSVGGVITICESTQSFYTRLLGITYGSTANPLVVENPPRNGLWQIDRNNTAWYIDSVTASVKRYGSDGGSAVIPMTSQVGTALEAAMVPRAIHYDVDSNKLIVVTRGTNNVPDIYEVTNLR
jgi:hypothetical protein